MLIRTSLSQFDQFKKVEQYMKLFQEGILQTVPAHAVYLSLNIKAGTDAATVKNVVRTLADKTDGQNLVMGFGASLLQLLGSEIAGMLRIASPHFRLDTWINSSSSQIRSDSWWTYPGERSSL